MEQTATPIALQKMITQVITLVIETQGVKYAIKVGKEANVIYVCIQLVKTLFAIGNAFSSSRLYEAIIS